MNEVKKVPNHMKWTTFDEIEHIRSYGTVAGIKQYLESAHRRKIWHDLDKAEIIEEAENKLKRLMEKEGE